MSAARGRRMKFGIQLPHFGPLASGEGTVAVALHAEALGFDSVWTGDHIVYPRAQAPRFGHEFYECVTTLTWVAARTARIGLGTAVLVLPYRNPLVLAKELTTLDVLAEGRLIVGIGVGWLAEEYAALGAPFDARGAATDEYLRIMRTLWTEDHPRFSGKFFRFDDLLFAPRPRRRPSPPVVVGGNTSHALRRAAELGDGWLPIWHAPTGRGFTPAALAEKITELASVRERAGRHERAEIFALMPLAIVDRPASGVPAPLVGTVEELVGLLRQYGRAGLDHVIVSPYYGIAPEQLPRTIAEVERLLLRFARDVRPHV